MGMIQSVVIVTGGNTSSEPVTIIGAPVQVLHFTPGQFVTAVDTSSGGSPRVTVQLAPGILTNISEIENRVDNLETDTGNLDTRVNDLEAEVVSGGRWEVPVIYNFTTGPTTLPAAFGVFYRINTTGAGAAEQFTLELPEVTAADVGRRIGIAEVSGSPVGFGSGGAEIYVSTTGGQAIDIGYGVPYDGMTGTRPRVVFIAAQMTSGPDTYGWTIESFP